jgi:hypothetical protein
VINSYLDLYRKRRVGRYAHQVLIREDAPAKLATDILAAPMATRWVAQPTWRRAVSLRLSWGGLRSELAGVVPSHIPDLFQPALNMIIFSESSAEATQPVRMGRQISARCRSSAARNDTPRYADVRQISVRTKGTTGSEINHVPPADLTPGWPRRLGREWWGTRGARVSRPIGAEGEAGQARGSRSFSRRVLHLDPAPGLLQDEPADATGYALPPPFIRAEQTTVVVSACCNEGSMAVTCGTPRCRPSAGQRVVPGRVDRFPSS